MSPPYHYAHHISTPCLVIPRSPHTSLPPRCHQPSRLRRLVEESPRCHRSVRPLRYQLCRPAGRPVPSTGPLLDLTAAITARTFGPHSAGNSQEKSCKGQGKASSPTHCTSLLVPCRHHSLINQYDPCRGSSIGRACGSYNSKEINLKVVGSSPTFGYSYIKAHQSSCSFCLFVVDDSVVLSGSFVVLGSGRQAFCCSGITHGDCQLKLYFCRSCKL
jgi:hypothetical protein